MFDFLKQNKEKTKKSQLILDLEQQLGFELYEVKIEVVWGNRKTFSKNGSGEITGFNFDYTNIDDIDFLADFKHLKTLSLVSTQVSNLAALKDLNNLKHLWLSETPVSDLSALSDIDQLTRLWLDKTRISDVTALRNLKKLKALIISHTQVSDIAALSDLINLIELDARNCEIRTIPLEIAKKFRFAKWENNWHFKEINLYGNPIQDFLPPEIINKGQKAVVAYLKAKQNVIVWDVSYTTTSQLAPLNEAKTLIIGGGGCGKTSLMRRLIGQQFNPKEDQTHGIRILKHEIEYNDEENTVIDVNIWDFGGQEINHATHQFFYSKRSLYLLVLDARQDEQAEYWLKYIESFGGDSPVLVVLNKIDENPAFEVNRRFLRKKFPNIKDLKRH